MKYRNIFVAYSFPERNISTKTFDKNRAEKLTNLLAHEINHGYSYKANGKMLKNWKEEGYAEYIAYNKTVDLKKEFNDSLNRNYFYMKRKCYVYFVYYLLNIKKIEMDMFINTNYNLKELDLEIKDNIK